MPGRRPASGAAAGTAYRLTDLGTPSGTMSCPQAVNAVGQVVGPYTTAPADCVLVYGATE